MRQVDRLRSPPASKTSGSTGEVQMTACPFAAILEAARTASAQPRSPAELKAVADDR